MILADPFQKEAQLEQAFNFIWIVSCESRVNTKSPLSNRSKAAEIDLNHYRKTSRLNRCLSVPRSRIL